MQLGEQVPQGCKIVAHKGKCWVANAVGELVERVTHAERADGVPITFWYLEQMSLRSTKAKKAAHERRELQEANKRRQLSRKVHEV